MLENYLQMANKTFAKCFKTKRPDQYLQVLEDTTKLIQKSQTNNVMKEVIEHHREKICALERLQKLCFEWQTMDNSYLTCITTDACPMNCIMKTFTQKELALEHQRDVAILNSTTSQQIQNVYKEFQKKIDHETNQMSNLYSAENPTCKC